MIQNMGWQMTEWQMKHNPLNVNDRLSNSANLTSLLTVDIFFHIHRGGLAHLFPKVLILEADGEDTNLVFSPTPSLLGDHCMRVLHLAEPNFA